MTRIARSPLTAAVLGAAALLFAGVAQAAPYDVDGAHAYAVFKIDHLGIAPSYGQFVKIGGNLDFDPSKPEATKLTIEIDADSVFTGNKKRDDHLKSPDFFDVKQHPKLTFQSTGWKKTGDATFEVTGNMTIHGQTRPVTVTVQKTGEGKDPWGNDRIGMTAAFQIDRMDYGIDYMPDGLGKKVDLMLSAEFIKKK